MIIEHFFFFLELCIFETLLWFFFFLVIVDFVKYSTLCNTEFCDSGFHNGIID